MSGPVKNWCRCTCGTRVPIDHDSYGVGYVGTVADACPPCWVAAEELRNRAEWKDFAYGPEPAVFDGEF